MGPTGDGWSGLGKGYGVRRGVHCNIKQYEELISELERYKGKTSLQFRSKMSREAFGETAGYDAVIYNYFNSISKSLT